MVQYLLMERLFQLAGSCDFPEVKELHEKSLELRQKPEPEVKTEPALAVDATDSNVNVDVVASEESASVVVVGIE